MTARRLELISCTAERPGLTIAPSASYNPDTPRAIGDFPELHVFFRTALPDRSARVATRVTSFGHIPCLAAPLISGVAKDWSGAEERYPPRALSGC